MSKLIDLTGQRFGKLVVIKRAETDKSKKTKWLCKCDCGNLKKIDGRNLRKGYTTSCGCYAKEQRLKATTKHGYARTKLDYLYYGMKRRCYNTKCQDYPLYGGRGIKMCEEWLKNRKTFFEWAIDNGYSIDSTYMQCTLDRIDVNGNYEPSNCRFVDITTQCNNRRSNHLITFNGETHNLKEWGEITGLRPSTISKRIKDGWSIEKALTHKLMKNQYC